MRLESKWRWNHIVCIMWIETNEGEEELERPVVKCSFQTWTAENVDRLWLQPNPHVCLTHPPVTSPKELSSLFQRPAPTWIFLKYNSIHRVRIWATLPPLSDEPGCSDWALARSVHRFARSCSRGEEFLPSRKQMALRWLRNAHSSDLGFASQV